MSIGREPTQRLLRAAQVADQLGVSVRTVWRLTSEGALAKPVKIGRASRWHKADVEAYIESLGS